MDKIELRVVEHDGQAIDRHWHAIFGMAGGTIGRSGQNKLIISDAQSSVARVHAMVRLDADGAFVANLSERDPIWVSEQEVRSGQEVALPLGASLRIGAYALCAVAPGTPFVAPQAPAVDADLPAMAAAAAPLPMPAPAAGPAPAHGLDASWDALTAPAPVAEPDALAFLQETPPTLAAKAGHRPLIPTDFDPFAPPQAAARQGQDAWNAGLPDQGAGELIAQRHDGLVQALPLQGAGPEALHDASHTGLPACFDPAQKVDPLALFGGGTALPADGLQAGARGSELGQAFNLPRIQPGLAPDGLPAAQDAALQGLLPADGLDLTVFESVVATAGAAAAPAAEVLAGPATMPKAFVAAPVPVPAAAPAAAPLAGDQGALLDSLAKAFIEGAGLDPSKTRMQITPEFMHTFGQALQVAVQGTIDLLAARSEIKREFRAGVTIIASGANNPLKFLPSAEGVITQMVHQTFPGFMKPLPAMQEAYADLHVHQLALMAGIRAAYAEALTRFDPSELERRTETHPGLLDKILTNGRKAALWDDYKHNFDVLRRHAEDDLSAFSGRSFVDAYEQAEQSARGQS
jgi:FHA domain-containing protein